MRPASRLGPARLAALATASLVLAALACTTIPFTYNSPPARQFIWLDSLQSGDYSVVITQASQDITESPGDAEAYLYRGLAELASGDLPSAQSDLVYAEAHSSEFPSGWQDEDQLFLYRGLMVLHMQLGNTQAANDYYVQAIKLAPAQQAIISNEMQAQTLDFNLTRP